MGTGASSLLAAPIARYALAGGLVAAATLVRLALDPVLHGEAPLIVYVLAVVGAAYWGGRGPGLVATVASAAVGTIAFLRLEPATGLPGAADAVRVALLLAIGGLSTELIERLRRAQRRAAEESAAHAASEARYRALAEELQRSTTHLQRVLDGLFAFVGVLTPDGTLVEANRAPVERAGLEPGDVIGRPFWDCHWWSWNADVQRELRAAVGRAAAGETVRYDVRVRMAGGQLVTIDFQLAPLRDETGRITHLIPSAVDVSERERAMASLRESEERFRAMADHSPFIVWVHDASGALVFVNHAYLDFFGVALDRVLGVGWQPLTHPDDTAGYVAAFERAFRERAPFRARVRVRRRDGEWRWVESRALPRFGPAGEFLGFVGSSPDVTEQVQALEQLREADRRKDDFLATLAHELRNPLGPIRTAARVLGADALGPEQMRASAEVIERQVRHMAWLLDDLIDISRVTRGRLELRRDYVELRPAVESAVETARPFLERKRHALDVRLPAEPVRLEADPVRLSQIVANLLTNAAKYTDPGGRVELEAAVRDGRVELAVRDSGIGIAPETLPRIFEMFSQVSSPIDRSEGGLGIGLALVKGLVELHGGTVEARSEGLGRGSEFRVTLPTGAVPEAHAGGGDRPAAAVRRRRVLIADDNRDAVQSLALLLQLSGHEASVAHSGTEALEVAARERPDALLLDIGMPGLNGYEVARRVRQEAWGRHVVLVAVTGWGQDEDKRRARAAGFDHHLTKPVDLDELEALLGRIDAGPRAEAAPTRG